MDMNKTNLYPNEILLLLTLDKTCGVVVGLGPIHIEHNRAFYFKWVIGLLIDSTCFLNEWSQGIINRHWRIRNSVWVVGMDCDRYVIHFKRIGDMNFMQEAGPWVVHSGLLSLSPPPQWIPNMLLRRMLAFEVSIWVEIWGLTLEYQMSSEAHKIRAIVRNVQVINWASTILQNIYYMRFLVKVTLNIPLLMGIILQLMMVISYGCNASMNVFLEFVDHVAK